MRIRIGRLSLFVVLIVAMALVLPACGDEEATPSPTQPLPTATEPEPTPSPLGDVEVLGVWGAEEQEKFAAMVEPWETETGGEMDYTGSRDLIAILTTRVAAGNPPDVAVLPNPGQMVELANDGELAALDAFLDMGEIRDDYAQGWIDLGSVDGKLYGIFMKADSKGTVWYNPKTFDAEGWNVPETWDEIIALSDQIVAAGESPWSVAVESAEASGWPATDWIGEILLHESGGDVYDQWVDHTIPWTDARIKSAWEIFGEIVHTEGYVPGGPVTALATNFVDGSYLPYQDPPKAAMYYLGAFTQGFIGDQFPDLVAGEDYSFFPFPTIDPQYAGAVTGAANVVVAFNDSPEVQSFMDHLASADAQLIWVNLGGFTAVNNKVSLDAYPNELARLAAEQLTQASVFRFDADDNMPSAVQKAFWEGTLDYIQNPDQLDAVLAEIEQVAVDAYSS